MDFCSFVMFFYVDPVPAPCVFRAGPIFIFISRVTPPDLFQFADHTSCETLPDRQCHPAEVVELLRQHPGLFFLDHAHHVVHRQVRKLHLHDGIDRPLHDFGRSDRFGRRLLVGTDQARYSEFRTAEITHHDD